MLVDAEQSSTLITGLTNGITYQFQINAMNSAGVGQRVITDAVIPVPDSRAALRIPQEEATRVKLQEEMQEQFHTSVMLMDAPFIVSDDDGISLLISVPGLDEGAEPDGRINVITPQLTLEVSQTDTDSAVLHISEELTLRGRVEINALRDELEVKFIEPSLLFTPAAAAGRVESVAFDMKISTLPPDTAINADVRPVIGSPLASGPFTRGTATYTIEDLNAHVGYVLNVEAAGVRPVSFTENNVLMQVDSAWINGVVASGLSIAVVKFDEEAAFLSIADCLATLTNYACSARFNGDSTGFSEFALVAVANGEFVADPSEMPTATQGPSPGPTFRAPVDTGGRTPVVQQPVPIVTVAPPPVTTSAPSPAPSPTATDGNPGSQEGSQAGPGQNTLNLSTATPFNLNNPSDYSWVELDGNVGSRGIPGGWILAMEIGLMILVAVGFFSLIFTRYLK